jgi:hypothetical protein
MPKSAAQIRAETDAVIEKMGMREVKIAALEGYGRDAEMREDALAIFQDRADQFDYANGVLIHVASEKPAAEYIRTTLRNSYPTLWPASTDRDLFRRAFRKRKRTWALAAKCSSSMVRVNSSA